MMYLVGYSLGVQGHCGAGQRVRHKVDRTIWKFLSRLGDGDGQDGQDGQDGISPAKSTSKRAKPRKKQRLFPFFCCVFYYVLHCM